MVIPVLLWTFLGIGLVMIIVSFVVERKKEMTGERKRVWYKLTILPWLAFIVGSCYGAFWMHRDHRQYSSDYIMIPKFQAQEHIRPEVHHRYLGEPDSFDLPILGRKRDIIETSVNQKRDEE